MGIMTAITTTTIVITTKSNPTRNNYRSDRPSIDVHFWTNACQRARRWWCRAAVNFQGQGEREKTHGGDHGKDSSARSIALSESCGALAYPDPLDAWGGSVLLTTIPECRWCYALPMQPPLFVRVAKVFGGFAPFFLKNGFIKTSILGDIWLKMCYLPLA
jgi:hypothetical protein